jgi:hypothetical protein
VLAATISGPRGWPSVLFQGRARWHQSIDDVTQTAQPHFHPSRVAAAAMNCFRGLPLTVQRWPTMGDNAGRCREETGWITGDPKCAGVASLVGLQQV